MSNKHQDYLLPLRGLASLGVVVAHTFGLAGVLAFSHTEFAYHELEFLKIFIPSTGSNFVVTFFVLSGYLMGKLFYQEKYTVEVSSVKTFYKNRFLRIAPLLYFNLLICLAISQYAAFDLKKLLGDIFFVNNLTGRSINLVTWSLSYEMQYYVLSPFVFYIFGSGRISINRRLLLLLVIFIPASFAIKQYGVINFFYAFFAGFLLNTLIFEKKLELSIKSFKAYFLIPAFVLTNLIFYALDNLGHHIVAEAQLFLFTSVIIFVIDSGHMYIVEDSAPAKCLSNRLYGFISRILTFFGKISYGVYLWHFPIILLVSERCLKGMSTDTGVYVSLKYHLAVFSVTILMTVLLSYATYVLVETKYRPGLYEGK